MHGSYGYEPVGAMKAFLFLPEYFTLVSIVNPNVSETTYGFNR